ncbi:phage tail protein [Klebsiella quasipneumoniae subsp. similipneumoniae]|uniref:phage tail-collar fiber domain-containing protein n=1 Tax=Klebsiella quasipneumoniae TaxID=1463165 RepID=UPI0038CF32F0
MAENKYSAILTATGKERMAQAIVTGKPVVFTEMAVGDGNGAAVTVGDLSSGLINEKYRAALNRVEIADMAANVIRTEILIMPQVGGFWIREAALYDEDGECIAVANLAPTYKPLLSEGAGRMQSVNLWIAVSNTAAVELQADPTVIIASVDEVNRAKREAKDYADEVVSQLDTDIKQAITDAVKQAVSDAWEEDNPVGTTRFFNQNLNPNERWPWSKWVYTGENKTIRIGKADGSNVGQSGGSDNVTLQQANLPAVQVNVSGETSEQPEQTLTTKPAGKHKHGGVPSRKNPWEIGGDVSQRFNPANLGETDEAPDHEHDIDIPPHHHDVTGKTANLGEGKSFSVVEAHTLLMCWSRVA